MEFSIYKLDTLKDNFVSMLREEYKMEMFGEAYEDAFSKSNREYNLKAEFYFYKKPSEKEISWFNYWAPFFNISENQYKNIESTYGIIIIEIEDHLYVISLGRGYHYANKVAIEDFGFDIAEKIIKEDAILLKSAKFYKQTKSRSLTQYNSSFVSSEVGESNELIIGKLEIDESLDEWKLKEYTENAVFGIAVKVSADEYKPKEVLELVYELHLIYNFDILDRETSFPRLKVLKDNDRNEIIIADLNKELLEKLKDGEEDSVSLSYFTEMDGDIFVQPIHSNVRITYRRRSKEVEFNLRSISEALDNLQCEDLSEVKISSQNTNYRPKPLLKVLDYYTQYRNEKSYCLFNGRWAVFNQSYIDYINREIIKVNEITEYKEEFNLQDKMLTTGEEIIKENPTTYGEKTNYREYNLNVYLSDKYGFQLYDRTKVHKVFENVEFADLYDDNRKELIHVKIGSTKDWRYCIRQSSQVAPLLNIHKEQLMQDGIPEVKILTLLLIVDTKNIFNNHNVNFRESKSLYFKTEIIEWFNIVREYGFQPRVIISKDQRNA